MSAERAVRGNKLENMKNKRVMKRIYNHPEVQVAEIRLQASVLVGSAGGSGSSGAPVIHTGIPNDEQW